MPTSSATSTNSPTDGPTALVTGATNGIGRAVALKLAADGFTVLVHGRDAERGAAVVAQIQAAGGQARFVQGDLGNAEDVARLAAEVGCVEVLVNNGGFSWSARPLTWTRRRTTRSGTPTSAAPTSSWRPSRPGWPNAEAARS